MNPDLNLHVGQLNHNDLQAKNINVAMALVNGDLLMPVSFVYDNAPTSAMLAAGTSGDIPLVNFSYSSKSFAIAPLLRAF